MKTDCEACRRLAALASAPDPHFIAESAESIAFVAQDSRYEGWTVLLLKEHVEHLAELSIGRQCTLFGEVARIAEAIRAAFEPVRINYECLGNLLHHVHWHVIPRAADDPEPKSPVWHRLATEPAPAWDRSRLEACRERLRHALGAGCRS